MKHLLPTLSLLLAAGVAAVAQCVMPPFLKDGDRVAVISPSSTPDSSTIVRGCQILRQWGYEPVVGIHALDTYYDFAGTTKARTDDLLWALRDSTIRAIVCTRGGDGAIQLLPYLQADDFRKCPKWLIGFSDITTLHSMSVASGVMSIHGSMLHAIASRNGNDTVSVTLRRLLRGKLPTYRVPGHAYNQPGRTTGRLVGGNFAVLSSLAGSDYDCLKHPEEGLILFIEDVDETVLRIDRLLHQLEIRGVLPQLRGIIVGQFSRCDHTEIGFDSIYRMLHEYLQHYDMPVCYDFPVGHASLKNFPMIEGASVSLTVDKDGACLEFLRQE